MAEYDLIVIGAGPGGYVAAIRGAQKGLKVAVVEKEHAGGCCLNRGCVPTKSFMHAAHLYREIQHAEKFGIDVGSASIDINKLYENKNNTVATLRGGVEQLFKSNKIDYYKGRAAITGENTVKVYGEESISFSARNILIAVGGKPQNLPGDLKEIDGIYTSDDILGENPIDIKRIAIIGAGVIALEFASFYSDMGCEVTVIARSSILRKMDKEISQNLTMIMKKRGVKFETNANIKTIEKTSAGLKCVFEQKEKELVVECDAAIAAMGRSADVDGLFEGFDKVQIERGAVVINENYQTSVPSIYSIGDCTVGSIQLAHVASAEGINAVCHMIGEAPAIDMKAVPSCIYTDPEIATVGLSADEAKEQGIPVKTGKFIMNGNAKTMLSGQERSFMKVVFNSETGKIIGAQLMCARATDMISELVNAVSSGLDVHELSGIIRPHPTFVEGITEAVEDVIGLAVHIAPKVKL